MSGLLGFWQEHGATLESWQKDGRNYYRLGGPLVTSWNPNECVYLPEEQGFEALVRELDGDTAILETAVDWFGEKISSMYQPFLSYLHFLPPLSNWHKKSHIKTKIFPLKLKLVHDLDFFYLIKN